MKNAKITIETLTDQAKSIYKHANIRTSKTFYQGRYTSGIQLYDGAILIMVTETKKEMEWYLLGRQGVTLGY